MSSINRLQTNFLERLQQRNHDLQTQLEEQKKRGFSISDWQVLGNLGRTLGPPPDSTAKLNSGMSLLGIEGAENVQGSVYDDMPEEDKEALRAAAGELAAVMYQGILQATPTDPSSDAAAATNGDRVQTTATALLETASALSIFEQDLGGESSPTDNVVYASLEAMAEAANGQLGGLALQAQASTNAKKDLRADMADVRETLANWPEGAETQTFYWTEYDDYGKPTEYQEDLAREQAEALYDSLASQEATMSDLNQLQTMDLQALEQRQQEVMEAMSNILKILHDTAKAIIGNLRA